MNVLKFGGTSIGTAERFKAVAKLVSGSEIKIVVLSAMSGTTNSLVEIANRLYTKHNESAIELIDKLETEYSKVVDELYADNEAKQNGKEIIKYHFDFVRSFTQDLFTAHEEKAVLAQGELISSALFHNYLIEQDIDAVLLPALNFMRIDTNSEPDNYYINENLNRELYQHQDCNLFITQGYICRNLYGEIVIHTQSHSFPLMKQQSSPTLVLKFFILQAYFLQKNLTFL
jgi:aspartate kinase